MRRSNLGSTDSGSIPMWLGGLSIAFGLAGVIAAIISRSRSKSLGRGSAPLPKKLEEHRGGDMTLMVYDDDSMPIEMRVGLIQDLVRDSMNNPQLHALAQAIVGGGGKVQVGKYMFDVDGSNCGVDDYCKADAIGRWVASNVRYTGDVGPVRAGRHGKMESVDLFQAPHRTIEMGGGDCDDHSPLNNSLLEHAGVHGAHRVTAPKQMSEWQHIFSVANVGGDTVALDTTLPGEYRTGRMAPHLRETDFPSIR